MPKGRLLDECVRTDSSIDPQIMAETLGIRLEELAHLSWDRQALREVFDLINVVRPWASSASATWVWFRCERLTRFGGLTPDALVRGGRGAELIEDLRQNTPDVGLHAGHMASPAAAATLSAQG